MSGRINVVGPRVWQDVPGLSETRIQGIRTINRTRELVSASNFYRDEEGSMRIRASANRSSTSDSVDNLRNVLLIEIVLDGREAINLIITQR